MICCQHKRSTIADHTVRDSLAVRVTYIGIPSVGEGINEHASGVFSSLIHRQDSLSGSRYSFRTYTRWTSVNRKFEKPSEVSAEPISDVSLGYLSVDELWDSRERSVVPPTGNWSPFRVRYGILCRCIWKAILVACDECDRCAAAFG